jgi:hypothetical protein
MLGGSTIRSRKAKSGVTQTKNVMAIFDPSSWKPVELYKMREHDDLPRVASGSVGYEDIRIFRTDRSGLQGIAASLHLRRSDRHASHVEQVLLSFDEEYNIEDAHPIRGDWNATAHKNWVPFDNCVEPHFLIAIDKGTLFDDHGELRGRDAEARPSTRPRRSHEPDGRARRRALERAQETEHARSREERRRSGSAPLRVDVQVTGQEDLRGGTQLVRIGDDTWLGIGHSMVLVDKLKVYWHVWYVVDSRGKMKMKSPPMKLAPNGIEFAAGMGIDGDRVVVSFGVDDGECRLAETKLASVLEILRPV